ncbi:MAG: amino acid adenylation domain-containing protein, partial [Pyrinomonadaceae bacterium]
MAGGEALSGRHVKRAVREMGAGVRLRNGYGPTEATTFTSTYEVGAEWMERGREEGGKGGGEEGGESSVPIGRPIGNTRVYVMDGVGRMAATGVVGELYIGGEGLARGYVGRAEQTAERFVPDGVSGMSGVGGESGRENGEARERGGRLYRTGDLVRWNVKGELEYVGRMDDQVKVRGYRIEPGEVEAVLRGHGEVRDAVVVAVADEGSGGKRLVGYVAWGGEEGKAGRELREYMKARLPDYMVPSVIVTLDELPLNENGKVDRKRLPSPEQGGVRASEEFVAARSGTEEALAEIWGEVLGVERVGMRDNYFELGGDSIRGIQLVAKARERGLDFSIQQLFTHPTIEEMALVVVGGDSGEREEEEERTVRPFSLISDDDRERLPDGVEDAYPLTHLQVGMIFHSELASETAVYHDIFSLHLNAPLNEAAMITTLRTLIEEHEVLRTSFDLSNFSEPLQLVHERVELPVKVLDISDLPPEQQATVTAEAVETERHTPFEWHQAPLLRLKLYRRSGETFQFLLSFHHAILDGWSLGTFLTELFQRYWELLGTVPPELRTPPQMKFREYVALERQALVSEASQRHWQQVLDEWEPTLIPRWTLATGEGDAPHYGTKQMPVSPEVFDGLNRLTRQLGVSLKSTLMAAHLYVLSRVTGQANVSTGIVSHGRPEKLDSERVLGLFLNTVPFRLRLTGGSWLDLVRVIFASEREMLPYRHYPMSALQAKSGLTMPLFETSFNYVHFHVYEGLEGNDKLQVLDASSVTETNYTFAVNFVMGVSGDQLTQSLAYDLSELRAEQLELIERYYVRTLEAMALDPEGRYELHDMLSAAERQQLLIEWNDTQSVRGPAECVHRLIEAQARLTPEAVALVSADEHLSYRELERRANRMAHHLRTLGVGPEVIVGVCLESSPDLIVALLAILKAGGAYLPLDPGYSFERLIFMLKDAAVSVLISSEALAQRLPTNPARLIDPSRDREIIERRSDRPPTGGPTPDNLAYVIYTSGSTGTPKGTLLQHGGLCNLARAQADAFRSRAGSRVLQFASLSYDASVSEIFVTLMSGATLCLGGREGLFSGRGLRDLMREAGVTIVTLPPSVLSMLETEGLSSLETVVAAGEACGAEVVERWADGKRLLNAYGPTEMTVCATLRSCEADATGERPPIGRPLVNTQVYVFDERLEPAPLGARGEIYAGGDGLARGYLNRPELTAERFVPNPLNGGRGGRLYRTGDYGRCLPHGEIEFLGRVDQQVKVRGHRVEPGEIEAVLAQHAQLQAAAVVARADERGERQLVAYVVGHDGVAPSAGELREYLRQRLPDYMVPWAFVALETLPLTSNGKLDRRSLPAPNPSAAARREQHVAPRTQTEELLAEIWAQTLGVERVGVHDNFFDLGGHSLLAVQIISRVRQSFEVEMPLRHLFETPTVEGLAAGIEAAQRGGRMFALPPVVRVSRTERLPLSFAQERMWFLDQLLPGGSAYNMPSPAALSEPLNMAALEQSLGEVVRRHEALRTRFVSADGRPVQLIDEPAALRLAIVDLRGLEPAQRRAQLRRLAAEESRRPFDLSRGPLLRACLVRVDEAHSALLLTMHHIISDGWSANVLQGEWQALLQGYEQGAASPLSELHIQYADYAVWQRGWLGTEVWQRQMDYWRRQLAGAPALLELPTDHPRTATPASRSGERTELIGEELAERLAALSRQEGVTMFMLLLASYQLLLARYSNQHDIVIGTPTAGRNRIETEGLIGCFINTLVMRTVFEKGDTVRQVVRRVREVVLQAQAHADVPFEQVVEELAPERSLSHTPLFQALMLWQPATSGAQAAAGGNNDLMTQSSAKFDLTLGVGQMSGSLSATLNYNGDLFSDHRMTLMLGHWQALLRGMTTNPDQSALSINLLSEAEQQQVLREWNSIPQDTRRDETDDSCLHHLFEAQARRTPDRLAIVGSDQHLTYASLDAHASRLAALLRRLGVGPEVKVGVLLARTPRLLTTLLAILKAGGAYVPLDPSYPAPRLHFILSDSGARLLLSERSLAALLPPSAPPTLMVDEAERGVFTTTQDESAASVVTTQEGGVPTEEDGDASITVMSITAADAPITAADAPVTTQESDAFMLASSHHAGGRVQPSNVAYLIYTSGSTGRPKAVLIEHRSASRFLRWANTAFSPQELRCV